MITLPGDNLNRSKDDIHVKMRLLKMFMDLLARGQNVSCIYWVEVCHYSNI